MAGGHSLSLDKRGPGVQTLAGFPHAGEERELRAKYGSSSEASVDPGPTSYQRRPWANNEELLILLKNIFNFMVYIFTVFKNKKKKIYPSPALGHSGGDKLIQRDLKVIYLYFAFNINDVKLTVLFCAWFVYLTTCLGDSHKPFLARLTWGFLPSALVTFVHVGRFLMVGAVRPL